MKLVLDKLRKNKKLHDRIRKIYGKTLGLYRAKAWYMKNIGLSNGNGRLRLTSKEEGEKLMEAMIKSDKPFIR